MSEAGTQVNTVSVIPKAGPKDVFLHLLAMVTLYTSAINFGILIFRYINIYFPDLLENSYYYDRVSQLSGIRWAIASLIIVFPVYILITWFLNKIYLADPNKRNFRIRRWLIYLTLFIAAVVIIGDLVTLVYNLLGGELTVRFILKILTVLFIAGSIFGYYFWDLRKYKTE
jgi:hypothetical protein